MGELVLAVDIGNTNVKLAAFRGEALVAQWRLLTEARRVADEYGALLTVLFERDGLRFADFLGVSLSSTVPALVPAFRELTARYFGQHVPFVVVTPEARCGVEIAIDNPREMGADRIVDALAAAELHGLPAIILDFGTATTFDAVDADRRLLGTAIAPGLTTAMDGLFNRAARLSRVELGELARPQAAIGRTTRAAIHSGWVYGYVGLVEGLVARIKRELGGQALVIATGGLAREILAETDVVDVHDPLLTLHGLRLFWELNRPDREPPP